MRLYYCSEEGILKNQEELDASKCGGCNMVLLTISMTEVDIEEYKKLYARRDSECTTREDCMTLHDLTEQELKSWDDKGAYWDMTGQELVDDYNLLRNEDGVTNFDEYIKEFEHQEGWLNPFSKQAARDILKLK